MSIEDKIKQINTLKNEADALMPLKDWDQAFLEKIKIEFTYNSNKIEGNTITYGQTVKLLQDLVSPQNATTGEFLDIVNHKKVLDIVFDNYHHQYISTENIKKLHYELMKSISQWHDDGLYSPGQYKQFGNAAVRSSGKLYNYMQPGEVAVAMEELVKEVNTRLEEANLQVAGSHPVNIATSFHQKFLNEIHPFADGNGRVGRIFMNLILLKAGYPPVFIKEVDRVEYLKRFELTEKEPSAMLDFMTDRLIESLQSRIEFIEQQRK